MPGDLDEPIARHGAQRVRRVADSRQRIALDHGGEALDPREVGLDTRVAEAPLPGGGLAARAGSCIRGQQEHDAHADRARGLDDREGELIGLFVGRSVGTVVDVVELAHRRVACTSASIEALLGDCPHPARVERLRRGVHRLAPGPEVVVRDGRGAHLHPPAQVSLEGVRVPVDEPRDEQPAGQAHDVAPLPRPGRVDDADDLVAVELHRSTCAHLAAGLEHEIGDEQAAGHGSMGRSRPRSRAVSRASA